MLIDFNSDDWRAAKLSNLSETPFVIDDQEFRSVEGFIQHLNFPPDDFRRDLCRELSGADIMAMAYQADQLLEQRAVCYWKDEVLDFYSQMKDDLAERAIRAKFEQDRLSRKALRRVAGRRLVFDGNQEVHSSIFPELLLHVLNSIRDGMEVENEEG